MRGLTMMMLAAAVVAEQPLAAATLSEQDLRAIAALEHRMAPLPGNATQTPAPLSERMRETRVPSVSVAFIEEGAVKWARAYGEAVAGSGRRTTSGTTFQAASMSKAVAAAGALRMVDRGSLTLDEDVGARLRAWRPSETGTGTGGPFTLRQLLSHTAGLSVAGYPGYASGANVPTLLQSLAGLPPANTAPVRRYAPAGAQIAYSGGGFSVAQLLMSEAARQPFPVLMDRLVLRPAGMRASRFDAFTVRSAAAGHDKDGKALAGGGFANPELAAAGLWTTPSDYGRFLIALQRSFDGKPGALLSPASARAMMTPVREDYGTGLRISTRGGRPHIFHGGSNEGFRCLFVAYLDGRREGIVIMTNGEEGGRLLAAVQRTIAEAYGWKPGGGPATPRAPDD